MGRGRPVSRLVSDIVHVGLRMNSYGGGTNCSADIEETTNYRCRYSMGCEKKKISRGLHKWIF